MNNIKCDENKEKKLINDEKRVINDEKSCKIAKMVKISWKKSENDGEWWGMTRNYEKWWKKTRKSSVLTLHTLKITSQRNYVPFSAGGSNF